jgi:hypothetical protein
VSLALYFDNNMKRPIAIGLRARGFDVLLAREDGTARLEDERLLERATELGRVLVSEDEDFMVITAAWQRTGRYFAGFIRAPQSLSIGDAIRDLEVIAGVMEPNEFANRTEVLPLKQARAKR